MDAFRQAVANMNHAFLLSKTGCGIREGSELLNNANRAVIRAMREKYGKAYLGTINGTDGIREWTPSMELFNFCCDFCMPWPDRRLEWLICQWNEEKKLSVLSEIHRRLAFVDAKLLLWS